MNYLTSPIGPFAQEAKIEDEKNEQYIKIEDEQNKQYKKNFDIKENLYSNTWAVQIS